MKDTAENETTVKTLKVWQLEEGKEYREITEHTEVTKFRLYEGELEYSMHSSEWKKETRSSTLQKILSYKFVEIKIEIEKPFPSIGDKYYCISIKDMSVNSYFYKNDEADKEFVKANNIFKTEEDAEKKLEEIKKLLKGEL